MEWLKPLKGQVVGLDTAPLIYFIFIELRATYNLRTPDAIQVATALQEGARYLVTNDTRLAVVPGIIVLVLDHLIS